jgi:hypothetical protein
MTYDPTLLDLTPAGAGTVRSSLDTPVAPSATAISQAHSATSHREAVSRPRAVASTGLVRAEWSNTDVAAPVPAVSDAWLKNITPRNIGGLTYDGTADGL